MPTPDTAQGPDPNATVSPPPPVNTVGTTSFGPNNPLPAYDAPPPSGVADQDFLTAKQVVADAKAAVRQADAQAGELYQKFQAAQASDPFGTGDTTKALGQAYDSALRALANANTAQQNAETKMVDAATQAASRAKDPAQQAYYNGHAQQAQADAALAQAQAAALAAKTPEDVKNVQAQTAKAVADAQSVNLLSPAQAASFQADAAQKSAQASQLNALLPSMVSKSESEAIKANVDATFAARNAQAAVEKTEADVDKARADVAETQRRIANMPTEQQAQAAIDLGLNDKQADLNAKQQALEQARQLLPGAVAQQQANIAQTQATTQSTLANVQKGALGPLYGIGDQIDRYKQMIASGQLKPEDANAALTSYLNTAVTGATDFQRQQQIDTYNQAVRGQDVSLINNRLSTGASFAGGTLGTIGQLAAGAGPGHGQEMASAFQAALNMGRQFFGQIGGLQTPQTVPSAVSQAPVVHINIGSGAPSSGGGAAPAPAAPLPAPVAAPSLPAAPPPLAMPPPDFSQNPTTESIVAGLQAGGGPFSSSGAPSPPEQTVTADQTDTGDQTQAEDIPAMARGGIVTRPTVALIGERGPEAVVPLHPALTIARPQHVMDLWRDEIASGRVRVPGVR